MRVEDLHHKELLELDPEGGVIRFAGQRALLLDAVAMGLLRQYLVENFGLTAARAVLTQFGFAHGWRMAAAMQKEFKWANNEEWRRAGPRIYTLEGLFRTQPGSEDPLTKKGAMLLASYEAEQHLLHFGRSDSAVCWTICGLMSGYVSHTTGKEIYVLEDRCLGEGHAACHLLGRTREEWGDERAEELAFFDSGRLKECLDVSLSRVTETLKAAEEKLRAHRQALVRVVARRGGAAGDRRQEPEDAARGGPGATCGEGRCHGAHYRRERSGQGTDRAARPRRVNARGGAVHRRQLRRHHRDAPRERALRAHARRVHRRGVGPARPVRSGQPRNAAAGRDR